MFSPLPSAGEGQGVRGLRIKRSLASIPKLMERGAEPPCGKCLNALSPARSAMIRSSTSELSVISYQFSAKNDVWLCFLLTTDN